MYDASDLIKEHLEWAVDMTAQEMLDLLAEFIEDRRVVGELNDFLLRKRKEADE